MHGKLLTETVAFPLVLPHELFAFIISRGKAEELLAASHAAKYWSPCRQHNCPWGNNEYVNSISSTCIPVGLHGDEVRYTTGGRKLTGTTWNSVVGGDGDTKSERFVIFGIPCYRVIKHVTLSTIWAVLKWSFAAMASGSFPTLDHEGRPLSGRRAQVAGRPLGLSASLVEFRADWQWHAQAFAFTRYWGSRRCCVFCDAEVSTYTDFSAAAPWRATLKRDVNDFWQDCVLHNARAMVLECQNFHHFMLKICALHTINLGFAQD